MGYIYDYSRLGDCDETMTADGRDGMEAAKAFFEDSEANSLDKQKGATMDQKRSATVTYEDALLELTSGDKRKFREMLGVCYQTIAKWESGSGKISAPVEMLVQVHKIIVGMYGKNVANDIFGSAAFFLGRKQFKPNEMSDGEMALVRDVCNSRTRGEKG